MFIAGSVAQQSFHEEKRDGVDNVKNAKTVYEEFIAFAFRDPELVQAVEGGAPEYPAEPNH
jgi:hypothetical protein